MADVLRDQAARAERRERATPPPRDLTPLWWSVAAVVSAGALWFWVAPPAFVLPPPLPEPPPELARAELRMTVYQAVLRLDQFRDSAGFYPESLEEAFEGPEDVEGFTYQRPAPDRFTLVVTRGDQVLRFESGQSMEPAVADARRVLEEARE